jgi:hypothetical protein
VSTSTPKTPDKIEEVFGYLRLKTTDLNLELGLELPVGNSTYPGNTKEGTEFIPHGCRPETDTSSVRH